MPRRKGNVQPKLLETHVRPAGGHVQVWRNHLGRVEHVVSPAGIDLTEAIAYHQRRLERQRQTGA